MFRWFYCRRLCKGFFFEARYFPSSSQRFAHPAPLLLECNLLVVALLQSPLMNRGLTFTRIRRSILWDFVDRLYTLNASSMFHIRHREWKYATNTYKWNYADMFGLLVDAYTVFRLMVDLTWSESSAPAIRELVILEYATHSGFT